MGEQSNTEKQVLDEVAANQEEPESALSPRTVGTIENPDLQRMRRLAIVLSIILFTYSVAAVRLDTGETITPIGIPLKINNPEFLGIGLLIANIYAMLRFILYGLVKNLCPRRFRKVLAENKTENDYSDFIYELFPGEDRNNVIRELNEAFPTLNSKGVGIVEPENEKQLGYVEFSIPPHTELLSFFHDIDYLAPIWFSVIAITTWSINTLDAVSILSWIIPCFR